MSNALEIRFPHIEEKYAPAEKTGVRFELVGDYVSIGVGEHIEGQYGFKEDGGTMIGLEQFILAAEMLRREYDTQQIRRREARQADPQEKD